MKLNNDNSNVKRTTVALIASAIGLVTGIVIGATTGKEGFNKLADKAKGTWDNLAEMGKNQIDKLTGNSTNDKTSSAETTNNKTEKQNASGQTSYTSSSTGSKTY